MNQFQSRMLRYLTIYVKIWPSVALKVRGSLVIRQLSLWTWNIWLSNECACCAVEKEELRTSWTALQRVHVHIRNMKSDVKKISCSFWGSKSFRKTSFFLGAGGYVCNCCVSFHDRMVGPCSQCIQIGIRWLQRMWNIVLDIIVQPTLTSAGRCCGGFSIHLAKEWHLHI